MPKLSSCFKNAIYRYKAEVTSRVDGVAPSKQVHYHEYFIGRDVHQRRQKQVSILNLMFDWCYTIMCMYILIIFKSVL